MLTQGAKQQLIDCCRLGMRNQYGEVLEVELDIQENWESLILHEGTFASIGLKRFYIKDKEIDLKNKYAIPYRGFMMPVMDKDVIVIQCISGEFVILRIIGQKEDLDEIKKYVRKDNFLELGMTSYEEFKEANRRDLEEHKRISSFEAKFNNSPERLDAHGNVITSLDHYDNFEYIVKESNEQIYHIYNGEKEKRRLENKLIYLEDKKLDYDYCIDEKYIEDAIDAIVSLYPYEIEKYFTKGGEFIHDNINRISFETELTKSQVWKAWKYMNWIKIDQEIKEINKIIDDIESRMAEGRSVTTLKDDEVLPNLFR